MSIERPIENKVLNQAQPKLCALNMYTNCKASTQKLYICMRKRIPIEIDIMEIMKHTYINKIMSIQKYINCDTKRNYDTN